METMMARHRHCVAILLTALAAAPAAAGDMSVEEARGFIVGKLFAFNCFDGTRGAGRIYGDGSVAGTVQFSASGPQRNMLLPTGTLHVRGQKVCATLSALPFQPCFDLDKTSPHSFRGSLSGLSFAYCDFTRRGGRVDMVRSSPRELQSATVGSTRD
jgi:hypothetical protein